MTSRADFLPTLPTGRAHRHPQPISGATYSAAELMPGDRTLVMLDQRKLPREERYELLGSVAEVADAIRRLVVRGAPAIGVSAAYGMVLAARTADHSAEAFALEMQEAAALLIAARPTAVNLPWAVERMLRLARSVAQHAPEARVARLAEEARTIHREDVAACRRMGAIGAANVPDGGTVLTHCNAGALATGGYGTALGVLRAAREAGKRIRVVATETRPVLQGARLTAWELARDGFDVTLITDNMVGQLFARKRVDMVIVGADRIARSGDVANKIGTYGIACLAQMHGIPFDVAAPWSTVDMACASGAHIPIEARSEHEVLHFPTPEGDVRIAPEGIAVDNPSFDVTPASMIRAIYTERGTVTPVGEPAMVALAGGGAS